MSLPGNVIRPTGQAVGAPAPAASGVTAGASGVNPGGTSMGTSGSGGGGPLRPVDHAVPIAIASGTLVLYIALILSMLLHAAVGFAVYKRSLGKLEAGPSEQLFRVQRSSDDFLLDDATPPPDKNQAREDQLAKLSEKVIQQEVPQPAPGQSVLQAPVPLRQVEDLRAMTDLGASMALAGPVSPEPAGLPELALPRLDRGPAIELPASPVGGNPSAASEAGKLLAQAGTSGPGGDLPGGGLSGQPGLVDARPSGLASLPLTLPPLPPIDVAAIEIPPVKNAPLPEHLDEDFAYDLFVYHPGERSGPGYFRVDITAQRTLKKLPTMPKDVIILIDTSQSVWQQWIDPIARGVQDGLDTLNENDRFNIILFSDSPRFFNVNGIVPATERTVEDAKGFLKKVQSKGMTDVNTALTRMLQRDTNQERVYEIILITDGVPTQGVQDTRELLNLITRSNDLHASIYCVGVGSEQNRELLDYLSYRNRGFSVYANRREDTARVIRDLMTRLRYPIIKEVNLNLAGLDIGRVFPHNLPVIHQGEKFSVFGQFDEAKRFTLQLTGSNGAQPVDFASVGDLRQAPQAGKQVAQDWAFWKLHHLYSEMLRKGDSPAIRREMEALKTDFGLKLVY